MWMNTPDEDLALWCLLQTPWLCSDGGAGQSEARAGPSRLTLSSRVCSANRVWIKASSTVDTYRPFSTRISSPGRKPECAHTQECIREHLHGELMPPLRVCLGVRIKQELPSLKASPSGSTSLTKILLFFWLSVWPVTAKPDKMIPERQFYKQSGVVHKNPRSLSTWLTKVSSVARSSHVQCKHISWNHLQLITDLLGEVKRIDAQWRKGRIVTWGAEARPSYHVAEKLTGSHVANVHIPPCLPLQPEAVWARVQLFHLFTQEPLNAQRHARAKWYDISHALRSGSSCAGEVWIIYRLYTRRRDAKILRLQGLRARCMCACPFMCSHSSGTLRSRAINDLFQFCLLQPSLLLQMFLKINVFHS